MWCSSTAASRVLIILVCVAVAHGSDADPLALTRETLRAEFEGHLADPAAYDRLVGRECGQFPEGALYPYVLPTFAYTNLGIGSAEQGWARERVRTLIDLALPHVIAHVRPPGGDLARIEDYGKQATFLSMTGCMLGCYRLLGGDDRYGKIETAICGSLERALIAADGATIDSYPTYSWTFDTIPSLLALRMHERVAGGNAAIPLLTRHLVWLDVHAMDAKTHLPFSEQSAPGVGGKPPRGCDLSMRVCLLAQLDHAASQEVFGRYVTSFWRDTGPAAGFREWPAGHLGTTDVDSGPILDGIGMTATGVGIGSCLAADDKAKVLRLANELAALDQLRALARLADPKMTAQAMRTDAADPRYVTGFLYGDATLFYAVTWTDWGLSGKK